MRFQHQLRVVLATCAVICLLSSLHADDTGNSLTDDEKTQGFVMLFDGTSFEGWQQKGNWKLEDGAMARTGRGGGIAYTKNRVPDDFELRFQWKVGAGSNSGLYYRPGQYEYQILDNSKHADGKNPRTSAASLYFCMAPSHDATRKVGEWNHGRIVCHGTVIQHWLNGKKVIHLDYSNPKWSRNVELLKQRGGNLEARGANLNLQDHGDPVWYRGIAWRELPADFQLDQTTVAPATIPKDVLEAEAAKLKRIVENRKRQQQKRNDEQQKNQTPE